VLVQNVCSVFNVCAAAAVRDIQPFFTATG
jgi:hypothetical protein